MKLNIFSNLLLSIVLGVAAIHRTAGEWQKNDKCFDVSATCMTSDGVPCKDILQEKTSCKKNRGKNLNAILSVTVCNSKNNVAHNIEPDGLFLRLTGPAAIGSGDEIVVGYEETGMANPLPPTVGDENCQYFTFPKFTVDTCRSHFNYQVNAISEDVPPGTECRGFLFERNMVSACWMETNIECKIANKVDGRMIPCQDFVPQTEKDCIQDIEYHFFWENKSKFTVDPSPNLKNYKTFAKVGGKYLDAQDWWFHPIQPGSGDIVHFVHIESCFDVCKNHNSIPSAQIKVTADVIPQNDSDQKLVDGNYIQPCVDEFFHPVITVPSISTTSSPTSSPTVDKSRNISNSKGGKGKVRHMRKSRTLAV